MHLDIDLDPARSVMYETLVDRFGRQRVDETLRSGVNEQLAHLYDNQEGIDE